MIKNDTIFGLVTLLFLQQIKYLGLGVRLARWGYKTRTGVFCILRRHCIGVWRHNNRIFSASTVFILHGRHGLAFPFIPKCLLSSRSWVMKSTREKEQHRRECFFASGDLYRCYLIGRILEISLGGGQDRDERCFASIGIP